MAGSAAADRAVLVLPIFTTFGCVKPPHTHLVNTRLCVFCRLQQLDRHCQSSAQQVCELLAKRNQLSQLQEGELFPEELRERHVEVTPSLRPAAADVAAHGSDVFLSLNPCRCRETVSTLCHREPIPQSWRFLSCSTFQALPFHYKGQSFFFLIFNFHSVF